MKELKAIKAKNNRLIFDRLKRDFMEAVSQVTATQIQAERNENEEPLVDLKTFIKIMHLLGFIRGSHQSMQNLANSTREEEQLSDLWKCLIQRRPINKVRYHTLFLAVAGVLNLHLPEMLSSISLINKENHINPFIINLTQQDPSLGLLSTIENAYFNSAEDIARFSKRFDELALSRQRATSLSPVKHTPKKVEYSFKPEISTKSKKLINTDNDIQSYLRLHQEAQLLSQKKAEALQKREKEEL